MFLGIVIALALAAPMPALAWRVPAPRPKLSAITRAAHCSLKHEARDQASLCIQGSFDYLDPALRDEQRNPCAQRHRLLLPE